LQATAVAGTTTVTLPAATDTLVGKATTDTLTNKTLTAPVISTISNTGTLTLPTSTDTLVGRATTDTLTNKTLTTPVISSLSSASATALTLQSAGTTAITVDTSQNVGIGTASPAVKLHVTNSAGELARFNASTAGTGHVLITNSNNTTEGLKLAYTNSDGSAFLGTVYSAHLGFITGNTERMRIDSSGNLLVNTTTAFQSGLVNISYNSASNVGITLKQTNANNSGTFLNFAQSGTTIGSISGNATNTTYATSSDYRLKENIVPMTGALAKVAQLKPVTYKWKVDGSDGQGFIAHELQEVVEGCVTGEKDATREEKYEVTPAVKDEEGNITTPAVMGTRTVPVYQGIDTSFLVATLTAAIQELKAVVDAQAIRIATLEAK
jgi:hypothetical protein